MFNIQVGGPGCPLQKGGGATKRPRFPRGFSREKSLESTENTGAGRHSGGSSLAR